MAQLCKRKFFMHILVEKGEKDEVHIEKQDHPGHRRSRVHRFQPGAGTPSNRFAGPHRRHRQYEPLLRCLYKRIQTK